VRALVPVAVVAILAVTFLIVWLTNRRRETRRSVIRRLNRELFVARSAITRIEGEVEAQWTADYADIPALRGLLREYRATTDQEIHS
jgi:hypothetical protein